LVAENVEVDLVNPVCLPLVEDRETVLSKLLEEGSPRITLLLVHLHEGRLLASDHQELVCGLNLVPLMPPVARAQLLTACVAGLRPRVLVEHAAAVPLLWVILVLDEGLVTVLVDEDREQNEVFDFVIFQTLTLQLEQESVYFHLVVNPEIDLCEVVSLEVDTVRAWAFPRMCH
jgi:hypothetical protein